MKQQRYNPEHRAWKGISYKKNKTTIELKLKYLDKDLKLGLIETA